MFSNSMLLHVHSHACTLTCMNYVLLTSVCCIHSNVHGLGNIHCIRYLTAVDSIHSTSSAVHIYFTPIITSIPSVVEIPLNSLARNPSSIGEKPVAYARTGTCCCAVEGVTTFTNVLQGYQTVVLV